MRTHFCGDIIYINIGKKITIAGWINFNRIFSNIIFSEIRDHTGSIQIVYDLSQNKKLFNMAKYIKKEYVVSIYGIISKNSYKKIEIIPLSLKIINSCKNLPFYPNENNIISEEIRLKYRYIDIRRYEILYNLKFKHLIVKYLREFFNKNGFIDIDTPILGKSTPEGARDYLVPSRVYKKSFYALPQSPQIFKQILMIGGVNKYYQLAKCFRDEDSRYNRQPEFTQLDIEISFLKKRYLLKIIEKLMRSLFSKFMNIKLRQNFIKFNYKYAQKFFGTDKPNLKNILKLININKLIYNIEIYRNKDNIKFEADRLSYLLIIPNNYNKKIINFLIPNQIKKKISLYIYYNKKNT